MVSQISKIIRTINYEIAIYIIVTMGRVAVVVVIFASTMINVSTIGVRFSGMSRNN